METIGVIYEISGNPYINLGENNYKSYLAEFPYPSEIDNICKALKANGYDYEIIDGPFDLLNRHDFLKEKCKLFFNKSIGFSGLERKVPVPAIGQLYRLPMLGSSAYSMTLARHKYHTNRLLLGLGFNVPFSFIVYSINEIPQISNFPVIVKPNMESDSLGIDDNSLCFNNIDLVFKTDELIKTFNQPVVIEQFIPGEELKVAVFGHGKNVKASGCVNVLKNGKPIVNSIQTRDDVLNDTLSYLPQNDSTIRERALYLAEKIHQSLELNDYSRCDFRVDINGTLYCMEISTHPYISKTNSSFVSAALQMVPSYECVINKIIECGKERLNN